MALTLLLTLVFFPYCLQLLGSRGTASYFGIFSLYGGAVAIVATGFTLTAGEPIEATLSFGLPQVSTLESALSIDLYLDALSGSILSAALIIGAVVMRYSMRYLQDDPEQTKFLSRLTGVITCTVLMLLTRHLGLFIFAWAASSVLVQKLLLHFQERPGAQEAAKEKFWTDRLGDGLLIIGAAILYTAFGTLDFSELFAIHDGGNYSVSLSRWLGAALLLLILGTLVKSAQFPFYHWLPKSIEAPTPVSAILHAGVINAGGYLIIRLSPLLASQQLLLSFVVFVGMVTCLYGALVMSVQTDIKRQLAYSTVSQMGFMILQCGLGSFHIAALHIVGHSFYKAYAFLNSGTAVQLAKIQSFSLSGTYTLPSYWGQCLSLVMGISIVLVLMVITGTQTIDTPGSILLYIVLTLALAQTLLSTAKIILGLQYACLIGVSYVGLHHLWHASLGTILPESSVGLTTLQTVVIFSCGCAFFTLYLIQNNSSRFLHTRWGNALYVYLINRSYSGR